MPLITTSSDLALHSDTFVDFKEAPTSASTNKTNNIRNFLIIYELNNKELSNDIIVNKLQNAYSPFQYIGKNGQVVWALDYLYITTNENNVYMVIGCFENSNATMRIEQIKREFPRIEGLELTMACFAKVQKFTYLVIKIITENQMKLIGCPKFPL